jgi:predicted house-cleaning NTP pyrophosphatase (Maf/HAM1 superfamily)
VSNIRLLCSDEIQTASPGIDEKAIRSSDPKELVLLLAHAKADAVLKKVCDKTA